jgi:hypothetical protein
MRRSLFALAMAVVGGVGGGCGNAPSAEQCTKVHEHIVELEIQAAGGSKAATEEMKADLQKQKATLLETTKQKFMDECMKKTPKDVVECTLRSNTLEDAGKCDPGG